MRFAHLLASFYFEPWNLRPDMHANFGRILQQHLATPEIGNSGDPAAVYARRAGAISGPSAERPIVGPVDYWGNPFVPQMEVSDGVAVIPVHGVLGKRLATLDLRCGGYDYEHLAQFARMAEADRTIHTIVLDLDSPGGSCRGLPECAAVLDEVRQSKKLLAVTEGLCCSAAFYLACYAQEFYASPSASVGNVGTVLAACDNSREWEMKGWRLELFASGALKGVGFDGKQWSETERDFFRGWMQKKFGEFQAVVGQERPQIDAEHLDGRWLDGDIAEAVGFTDGTVRGAHELVAAAIAAGGK